MAKKRKVTKDELLVNAAEELQELLSADPEIDVNAEPDLLKKYVKEAASILESTDELTKETVGVLKELFPDVKTLKKIVDADDELELEDVIEIFIKLEILDQEENEPEEVKGEEEDLIDQVAGTDRMAKLKEIAKTNDEFKEFRGTLSKYKTGKRLQTAMLDVLNEEPEEVKPEKEPKPKKDDVKKEKTQKKPVEKKGPSPYGTALEIMCTNPDMSMKDLVKELTKKKIDTENGVAGIRTAYGVVRKIVSLLKENGSME